MVPEVFPLEKILTVSAGEYCESRNIPSMAPNGEVIVNYQFIFHSNGNIRSDYGVMIGAGTALIPKKKK